MKSPTATTPTSAGGVEASNERSSSLSVSSQTCLFCNQTYSSISTTCEHMSKHHGLVLPDNDRLLVQQEDLLRYLHSVIYDYHECLSCHAIQDSPLAIQQHMLSENHCAVDFESSDSEFAEFCATPSSDSDSSSGSDGTENEEPTDLGGNSIAIPGSSAIPIRGEDDILFLPSGKLLQSKKALGSKKKHRRPLKSTASASLHAVDAASSTEPGDDSSAHANAVSRRSKSRQPPSPQNLSLTKGEGRKRNLALRISTMRTSDQQALAHLLPAEQRALIAVTQKQAAKGDRDEQRFRAKMDRLGNANSKERFVNDVPGGKSHKNRFLAT